MSKTYRVSVGELARHGQIQTYLDVHKMAEKYEGLRVDNPIGLERMLSWTTFEFEKRVFAGYFSEALHDDNLANPMGANKHGDTVQVGSIRQSPIL